MVCIAQDAVQQVEHNVVSLDLCGSVQQLLVRSASPKPPISCLILQTRSPTSERILLCGLSAKRRTQHCFAYVPLDLLPDPLSSLPWKPSTVLRCPSVLSACTGVSVFASCSVTSI